jgi:hypothetical protein
VKPHHPFLLQQIPNADPLQVLSAPQVASLLTEIGVGVLTGVLLAVLEGGAAPAQLPQKLWQPFEQ